MPEIAEKHIEEFLKELPDFKKPSRFEKLGYSAKAI